MSLNKTKYIISQLAKTNKKNYENYVISRIWHLLNNSNIKIVTQQHVTTKNGRALTDLYFPQIQFHVEVDEVHHFNKDKSRTNTDAAREADIIDATKHEVSRIDVDGKTIENINLQIDKLIDVISEKFKSEKTVIWDIDTELNPETYIKKGKILVEDNVVLKNHIDVCNCFGLSYKGHQRATAKHPKLENTIIWFPKLYDNGNWKNSISLDGNLIFEEFISTNKKWKNNKVHLDYAIKNYNQNRVVFAHSKNNLGETLYRFKGVFKLNNEKSELAQKCVYDRISTEVKTFSSSKTK
jgi:SET and RING associated domain